MSDRPLRILMVTPRSPLQQGGVERHVLEVSRRIVRSGSIVTVLCSDPGGAPSEIVRDGVRIRSVRAWPARTDWCLAPGIWSEMADGEWDLVHIQSYHTLVAPLAMARALNLGIRFCVTFHGGGHSSWLRNRSRGMQLRALRPLLARASALVAVARFEIDLYGRTLRLPRERFVLIPNGTDVRSAPVASSDEGSVIASIGRLERYKGHHRVLDALPYVLATKPDARLLLVGSGPFREELAKRAGELGVAERVQITSVPAGDPAAMGDLLSRVSLVVLMSEFETHPLVGLEAAAAGRRLLVADRPGLSELAQDGLARSLPFGSSPRELAEAIVAQLAQAPPEQSPQLPDWDECATGLLGLYRRLVQD